MDKHDFLTGLAHLASVFEKEIPEPMAEAYWRILRNVSNVDWAFAVERIGSMEEFWPTPAKILKHVNDLLATPRTDHGSWAEVAAGATPGDLNRPARIGQFLANAYLVGDDARISYYESLVQHMSEKDMMMARTACDKQSDANSGGMAGSDRGYARFKAECERLGLADIVPDQAMRARDEGGR